MKLQRFSLAASVALFLLGSSLAARSAEYRLKPGDTVEIFVVGAPDLRQRLTLDVDGTISVASAGSIKAAGATVAELAEKLRRLAPGKAFRQPAGEGKEARNVAIDDTDIVVNIADYGPVYVDGDVARPGEQKFRPNLTVRQAVSLAGGFEPMRYRFVDPVLLSTDLAGDYQTLWLEQAREQVRLSRLDAQLRDNRELSVPPVTAPVPASYAANLAANETRQFSVWKANLAAEKEFLTRSAKSADAQLVELVEQGRKEKEGVAADTTELNRLREMSRQGNVTTIRVVEQERAMLIAITRLQQTKAQIIQITRERDGYLRQIERFEQGVKGDVLKEMQDAQLRLSTINAKIAAVAGKIGYVGTMRSQLASPSLGAPVFTLVRRSEEGARRVQVDEDALLEPGDLIEVAVNHPVAAPSPDPTASAAEIKPTEGPRP